ncbi:MAG: 50S ribosomal protein L17 [Deltaproteobacteria bacterium]|jgi:large subunit ribosomal protein L17|nr:50S ribosomal protein L17 [Deltaproteobacteria bacterium]
MRHKKSGKVFGKSPSHRKAMYKNMTSSLIEHGRIKTTVQKAKELRRYAEKAISWGTSLGELVNKPKDALSAEEKSKVVHHYRMAKRIIPDKDLLNKLFTEIAPLYLDRNGGYTRVVKSMRRRGDNAEMAIIELVDYDFNLEEMADDLEEETEE